MVEVREGGVNAVGLSVALVQFVIDDDDRGIGSGNARFGSLMT